jgi:hypothetical protein
MLNAVANSLTKPNQPVTFPPLAAPVKPRPQLVLWRGGSEGGRLLRVHDLGSEVTVPLVLAGEQRVRDLLQHVQDLARDTPAFTGWLSVSERISGLQAERERLAARAEQAEQERTELLVADGQGAGASDFAKKLAKTSSVLDESRRQVEAIDNALVDLDRQRAIRAHELLQATIAIARREQLTLRAALEDEQREDDSETLGATVARIVPAVVAAGLLGSPLWHEQEGMNVTVALIGGQLPSFPAAPSAPATNGYPFQPPPGVVPVDLGFRPPSGPPVERSPRQATSEPSRGIFAPTNNGPL